MLLLQKILRMLGWRPKSANRTQLEELLPAHVREELHVLAANLKGKHVSVRDLYEGEVARDTPEVGEEPFLNEDEAPLS